MTKTFTIKDLPEIARLLLKNSSSKTFLFYGEMGSGKTTMIKELAKIIGVTDVLNSPTYSIVNEYVLNDDKLFHFDFYRLEKEEEALDLGVEDYFFSKHWNLIEWPERVSNLLPKDFMEIRLSVNQDGSRTVIMMPVK